MVAVDEYQHFVYDNPEATPTERKAQWRSIEKKYLPYRNYDSEDYLERGGYWHQQQLIFNRPFYYVDYALAQIRALQLWVSMNENFEAAWKDYLRLCKLGGSMSFTELIAEANLASPFEDGCVEAVVIKIADWLDNVDDQGM